MRNILALLFVLCLVVSPVLAMSAFDAEGTTDGMPRYNYFEEIVKHAADIQQGKQYQVGAQLHPSADTTIDRLQNDDVYFFHGHCYPGMMGLKYDSMDLKNQVWVYGEHAPSGQKSLGNLKLSNQKFMFFDCCNSAGVDPRYNGLTRVSVDRGAKCAFGFREELRTVGAAIKYGRSFWDEAAKGTSWPFCHYAALKKLEEDEAIKKECEKYGTTMCGYSTLEPWPQKGGACMSYLQPSPVMNETVSPMPEPTPSQRLDLTASGLTEERARDLIRDFTGNTSLLVTYQPPDYELSPNAYRFGTGNVGSGDDVLFDVNSVTGRVVSMDRIWWDRRPKPGEREVSLEEAYVIAENFAKKQYPELWNTSDTMGVNVSKRVLDNGDYGYEYPIGWYEEYYYPNKTTPGHITIRGLKYIELSVTHGGEIHSYYEDLTPRNESVSLIPDLTEDQAWVIAKKEVVLRQNITLTDADKHTIWLKLSGIGDNQALEWIFDASTRNTYGGRSGADVVVDAHDGHIASYELAL